MCVLDVYSTQFPFVDKYGVGCDFSVQCVSDFRECQKCMHDYYYKQVYLPAPMDCATLLHAKSPIQYCMPCEITRQQCCERYLKHTATQTVTCWLLAHTCTIRPKLNLVDLLSSYYTSKFATNAQEIEPMELKRKCLILTYPTCVWCPPQG